MTGVGSDHRNISATKLLEEVMDRHLGYAAVRRKAIPLWRRRELISAVHISEDEIEAAYLRETLVEHLGHVALIAVTLYPYLKARDSVSLGNVLSMLALHDIGELETGDILSYDKTSADEQVEMAAAQKLVPEALRWIYDSFVKNDTLDAHFAVSVDALAPLIHDLEDPDFARKRWNLNGFCWEDIYKKKAPLMEWDETLSQLFLQMTKQLRP